MATQFIVSAFGMLFDESGRVLLCLRNDYDLWNLPGGGLEPGETPDAGVIREVKEETGFDVRIKKLAGVYTKKEQNTIVFSFVCEVIGGAITLNEEARSIEYFAIDALPPNTSPKQVERIHDAARNLSDPIFKVQTGKSSIELIQEGKL